MAGPTGQGAAPNDKPENDKPDGSDGKAMAAKDQLEPMAASGHGAKVQDAPTNGQTEKTPASSALPGQGGARSGQGVDPAKPTRVGKALVPIDAPNPHEANGGNDKAKITESSAETPARKEGKTGQDVTGQDGTGQEGTGQDGTGQDGTGQDQSAANKKAKKKDQGATKGKKSETTGQPVSQAATGQSESAEPGERSGADPDPDTGTVTGTATATGAEEAKEKTREEERRLAYERSMEILLPTTPEEVRAYRQGLDAREEALAAGAPASMRSRTERVRL